MDKNSKILNKITYAIFAIFFFACVIISTSLSLKEVKADEDALPTLKISTDIDSQGYAYAKNDGNFIYFNLSLDKAPESNVKVYFHAEDRSAVSEAGDYYLVEEDSNETDPSTLATTTHSVSYITINEFNYKSITIQYHVSKVKYGSYNRSYDSTAKQYVDNYIYNYFIFAIDRVENATYTGSNYNCRLNYSTSIPVYESFGEYYCSYFTESNRTKFNFDIEGWYEEKNYYLSLGGDCDGESWQSVYSKVVSDGYGEMIVNGMVEYVISNKDDFYDLEFYLYSNKTGKRVFKEVMDYISTSGNYYYDSTYKSDMDLSQESSISDNFTEKLRLYEGADADDDDNVIHQQITNILYTRNRVWYYLTEADGYEFRLQVNSHNHYRDGYGYITEKLTDRKAPTLENYYIDTSSILNDGKIRLMMRYSEPVDAGDSEVKASMQDRYDILFRYVEGAGTNTLVYEANVNTDDLKNQSLSCTYISLEELTSGVTDIGYNWQTESRNATTFQFGAYEKAYVSIDLRKPALVAHSSGDSADITRTREINITCNKLTNGRIYYCFVPENEESKITYDSEENFQTIIENSSGDYTNFVAGYQDYYITDANEDSEAYLSVSSPPNINGRYYLYVLAVSSLGKTDALKYGKVTTGDTEAGYSFDNEAPTLTITRDSSSTATTKIFNFEVEDKFTNTELVGSSCGIEEIGFKMYDASNPDNVVDFTLWSNSDNIDNTITKYDTQNSGCYLDGIFEFSIVSEDNGDGLKNYLKCNNNVVSVLDDLGYGSFYYYFYAVDELGNISTISDSLYTIEKYDLRTLFSYSWSSNRDNLYSKIENDSVSGMAENVYNRNSDIGSKLQITITNEEAISSDIKSEVISIYKIYYKDKLVYTNGVDASYAEYVEVANVKDGYKTNISITPLKSGHYKLEFMSTRTLTDTSSSILYAANPVEFYVTDRTNGQVTYDETENYNKVNENLVFNNKVFQLSTNYYYLSSTDNVTIVPYNNTQNAASFSNSTIASNYVKFMEYQDIQLLRLEYDQDSTQIVAFLNSSGGSAKYQKADGQEGITAALGQTWIRYKRSSWTTNSGTEGWAYYFYSDRLESSININTLLGNNTQFANAITAVVSSIVKQGSYVYLTEDSYLDSYNAPYLTAGQQHYNKETATTTMIGNQFASTITFDGDANIYSDYIEVSGVNYKLATNMQLSITDSNKLYYYDKQGKQLVPINATNGQTLATAMENAGSGIYKIVEIDNNGVSEFNVYIDVEAPVVSISWVGTGDDSTDKTFTANLNGHNDGDVYSAKNLTIKSVSSSLDIDPLAYVAVYQAPSYSFVSIQYYSTLADNPIVLEDGNYYVVVGDRSGNVYTFTAQVCSEDLEVNIEVIDNSYVIIKTNRSEDQIDRFEVRCNNIIQTQAYSSSGNKYSESGYYNIYIRDIYGNTNSNDGEFGSNYMFERELPVVTWYYLDSSSIYTKYDSSKSTILKISKALENGTYYINTSRYLKFSFDGEYTYEITGVDSSNITKSSVGHYAIIEAIQDWQLEIWYTEYPDVRAKYIVTMDTTSPSVQVSYRVSTYDLSESDALEILAKDATLNTPYEFSSVTYDKGSTITKKVSEGDTINSNFMTLEVSDASGLKSVYIYIDDELYKSYEDINGKLPDVSLSKSGSYRIVATDSFDNTRTFTFDNLSLEKMVASIDNNKILSDEDVQYGNSDLLLTTSYDSTIMIKVGSYVLLYTLENGKLYLTKYICIIEDGGTDKVYELSVDSNAFFDVNNSKIMAYEEKEFIANNYQVEEYTSLTKIKGIRFYISYDVNKNIIFHFVCPENERLYIEASAQYSSFEEPYYYNVILSKELSKIGFVTTDDVAFDASYENVTRINNNFKPILNNIDTIKSVEASYSATKEFINFVTVYNENGYKAFDTTENGFYLFRVENVFGNITEYVINRSDEFIVLSFAEYEDKETSSFDSSYGTNVIKANGKVTFEAYTDASDKLEFTLKNLDTDETKSVLGQYIDGYYSFVFTEAGNYKFTLEDTFGNIAIKYFEIKKTELDVNSDILTGFNEKALLKDAGYTNQKITIVESKINENDVKYISLITTTEKDDSGVRLVTKTEKILYNSLTQDAVGLHSRYAYIIVKEYKYYDENIATLVSSNKYVIDLLDGNKVVDIDSNIILTNEEFENKLVEAIGVDGNNDYQVLFRDSYGGIDKKEVHYKEDSTLTVTRKTRTDKEEEVIEIDNALENGVWSNAKVIFTTTSTKFEFTKIANGENQVIQTLPYELDITSEGKYEYQIKYLDEYGNEYEIMVYLVRQELDIDLIDEIDSFIIEDIETTRDNIQVEFSSKSTCTYRLNSGEEIEYNVGDILYRDGTYRFTVEDYAGNVTSKTFKKDTICEFSFEVPSTEKTLINGEVINTGYVKFNVENEDTTYISKVYYDDELSEVNDTYSKAGKWSFIIEDLAGNKTMFEFYIINHDLSKFEYTTPNNYKITELWLNAGDDILVDYMSYVNDHTANSDFSIDENGTYTVVMSSIAFNKTIDFSFTINKTLPNVTLTGCDEGEKTINDITLDGVNVGDTIVVYKDGKLTSTIEVEDKSDIPTISEGGKYEVIITNEAGVSKTLSFIRTKVPNTAGSILIIVILGLAVAGIMIGTILRNRQKIDD